MLLFALAVAFALSVSFVCSIAEATLLSVGPARVEALARAGNPGGLLLRRFKAHPDRAIAAILVLNTIAHTGGATLATDQFVHAFPDVSPEASGKDYPKLVDAYKKMFGEAPIQGFHAQAYDAAKLLAMAIEKVAVTEKDGTTYIGRKALRDAVFNAPEFEGMSGPIKCDQYGQCGKFKFAAYEFTSADPSTFDIGKNPKKIYPTK